MELDFASLTEEEALELTKGLLDQLNDARTAVEQAQRRAVGVRKVIDGLAEVFPAVEDLLPRDIDGNDAPRPRGAEAVRYVLQDSPGEWLTIPQIVSTLGNRNWLPTSSNVSNAVRSALERLVDSRAAVKGRTVDGTVVYMIEGSF